MPQPRMLTLKQFAAKCGVTRQAAQKWLDAGLIRHKTDPITGWQLIYPGQKRPDIRPGPKKAAS